MFEIKGRGTLKSGNYADLVISDPEKISYKATFNAHISLANGIYQSMVNGQVLWRDGEHTGNCPGKKLFPKELTNFHLI